MLGSISVVRSRPSPRASRDLTVPPATPSTSAVSASDRASRYRHATTSRVPGWQRGHRREQLTAGVVGEDDGLGRGSRLARGTVFDQGELVAGAPSRRATAVPGLVGDDGEDPGPERRSRRDGCPARGGPSRTRPAPHPPRLQATPQIDVARPRMATGWKARYQRRVGIHVTLLRSASELDIVGWTALHRRILAQVEPTRTRRPNVTREAITARAHSATPTRMAIPGQAISPVPHRSPVWPRRRVGSAPRACRGSAARGSPTSAGGRSAS